MRHWAPLALAAVALTACSRRQEPPIGAAPAERAAPAPVAAAKANRTPLYVGRWAATRGACAGKAWVLTLTRLQSPSALNCELAKAQVTSAGYAVDGACSVGKATQPTRLLFTITGSGPSRSLTLSSGPFAEPLALTRCADDIQAASAASSSGLGTG